MARKNPQPKPLNPAEPGTPPKRKADRGPGKRLTYSDRYRLLELHRANPEWSYVKLAEAAGVNPETARLSVLAASRSAVDLMAAYAEPMLRAWIKAGLLASLRGDHRPAKEWLMHAGILDPLPDAGKGSGPSVVIINAPLPGMPGYQPEVRVLPGSTSADVDRNDG
jgi:hypothetical protein